MPSDKRIFVNPNGGAWKGGMDKDSELHYVQNGYYRDARNISFMVNGDRFTVKNLKGNISKSYTLNSGANTCIGSFDDKGNETVYYFIYNGSGDHEVLKYQYNSTVDAISQVAEGAGFAFEVDKLITGITVVNDRFLVWGQEGQEIGCIDLDNPPAATITTAADRWEVELCKIPDLTPPDVMYVTDEQRQQNALKGYLYQFRYRYIYEGNFRSPLSTISKVPIPDVQFLEFWDSSYLPFYDNTINLTVPQPDFDAVVRVELFVRYANDDDTKDANLWYKFGEIPYDQFSANQPVLEYAFTGNEALTPLDPAEALTETSFFPKECKEVVFLPSNVLGFLNFKEGLDISAVEPEVEIWPSYNTRPTSATTATTTASYNVTPVADVETLYNSKFNIELTTSQYNAITIGGTVRTGDAIQISIPILYTETSGATNPASIPTSPTTVTKTVDVVYIVKDEDTTTALVAQKIKRVIDSIDTRYRGFGGLVAIATGATVRIYQGVNETNSPYQVSTTINHGSVTTSVTEDYPSASGTVQWEVRRAEKTFKRNARHPFAIEYLDSKGRRSGAIPLPEVFVQGTWETSNDAWVDMNIVIGHLAPTWAEYYQILYAKNQTYQRYLQLPTAASNPGGTTYVSNVFDSIDNFATKYSDDDDTSPYYNYNYVQGDRIRVLGQINTGTLSYFTEEVDAAIQRADVNAVYFESGSSQLSTAVTAGYDLLVEVYTPRQESTRQYYEIAYQGTIDSNRYHSGNVQDQDATNGAHILLDNHGDAYNIYIQRTTPSVNATDSFVEFSGVSPLFESNVTDIGRINIEPPADADETQSTEVSRDTGITWTQPIIKDSVSNGLSVILETSVYNDFGSDYGSIQKAFLQQDRKLVIYFEDKVGFMGVFSELRRSPNGDVSYATDALANQINYYAYDGGIGLNPESFAYYDTTQYFLSPRNNAVCRLANDGITEISKYGMTSWFNENLDVKSNNLSGLITPAAYDERNESYVLSFRQQFNLTYVAVNPETSYGFIFTPDISGSYGEDLVQVGDTIIVTDTAGTPNTYTITITSVSYNSGNGQFTIAYSDTGTPLGTNIASAYFIRQVETVMFNEPANAWVSFLDLDTEYMCTCGVDYVSFRNGVLWLHNVNSTHSSFYGSGVTAEVTVPFNIEPSAMKVFMNIEQETNDAWISETDGDVSTPAGQTSQIFDEWYEQKQPNQFSAWIGKDTSTPTALVPTNKVFEGFDLRDTALQIRLTQDASTESKLRTVTVNFKGSNLSS